MPIDGVCMQAVANNHGDITTALHDIIARLDRTSSDLWDAEDIAIYLRLSKKTVQNHVLEKDGFPRAITLTTGGRRWLAKEVKAWVLRHR
jgi:predicted DNA-binding transcriptional regulator AlpA